MLSRRRFLTSVFAAGAAAPVLSILAAEQAEAQWGPGGPMMAPPPLRREVVPPPRRGFVWVPGHWTWSSRARRYVWVSGQWMPARAGWRYSNPNWVRRGGTWVYVPGRWVR
ncbi:hypothetical protein ABLE91_13355 [Aquabacter sp. CN5-332]|uniref:hypothetical protein n=1 Tax=Aquabacter sp. CN5-332 TaxID=3156608 RepID=UPI0032B57EB6